MQIQTRFDATWKTLAVFATALCLLGAAVSIYVVLVRVPALAHTKLDLLLGTLQGVGVGLLFAIAALLIGLMHMVRRASHLPLIVSVGAGTDRVGPSGPAAVQ